MAKVEHTTYLKASCLFCKIKDKLQAQRPTMFSGRQSSVEVSLKLVISNHFCPENGHFKAAFRLKEQPNGCLLKSYKSLLQLQQQSMNNTDKVEMPTAIVLFRIWKTKVDNLIIIIFRYCFENSRSTQLSNLKNSCSLIGQHTRTRPHYFLCANMYRWQPDATGPLFYFQCNRHFFCLFFLMRKQLLVALSFPWYTIIIS